MTRLALLIAAVSLALWAPPLWAQTGHRTAEEEAAALEQQGKAQTGGIIDRGVSQEEGERALALVDQLQGITDKTDPKVAYGYYRSYLALLQSHLAPSHPLVVAYAHVFSSTAEEIFARGNDTKLALEANGIARGILDAARHRDGPIAAEVTVHQAVFQLAFGLDGKSGAAMQAARALYDRGALTDPDTASLFARIYNDYSLRIGRPEQATAPLLAVYRAARANKASAAERLVVLLTALAGNAAACNDMPTAEKYGNEARQFIEAPDVLPYWQVEAFSSIASILTQRDGGGTAGVEFHRLAADAAIRGNFFTSAAIQHIAIAKVLRAANRSDDAAAEIAQAQALLPRIEKGQLRFFYGNLGDYYGSYGSCAERLDVAVKAQTIPDQATKETRADRAMNYASILAYCDHGPEALAQLRELESLAPARKQAPSMWAGSRRGWIAARAYRRTAPRRAVEYQRAACNDVETVATAITAGKAGAGDFSYALEPYLAQCRQALARFVAEEARPGSATMSGSIDTPALQEAFLLGEQSLQSEADDGTSVRRALSAADARGAETGALARQFESTVLLDAAPRRVDFASGAGTAGDSEGAAGRRAAQAALRARLTAAFPGYWAIRGEQAPSVAELAGPNGLLRAGESYLLVLDGIEWEDSPLVFLVSRDGTAMAKATLSMRRLVDLVTDLRAAMRSDGTKLRPFDRGAAHEIYAGLFGDPAIAHILAGTRNLLFSPSGSLASIPLSMLVSQPVAEQATTADNAALRATHWMIDDMAITYFLTPSSLRSLRRAAAPPRATPRILAMVDPAFAAPEESGDAPVDKAPYPTLDDLGDRGEMEARNIGRALHVAPQIMPGRLADEARLKGLSLAGTLADFTIIDFATHGLAHDASAVDEPALALARPARADREDGLLTITEIAALRLGAPLVILSGCQTGFQNNGRAPMSMMRAFLRAGAQSTMVTGWDISNDLGPAFLDAFFAGTAADDAQAMRGAARAVMDGTFPNGAHPAHWAAYMLFGDGLAH